MEKTDAGDGCGCPSADALRQFAVGKTGGDFDAIEAHLSACRVCAGKLDQIALERDSLVERVRLHARDTVSLPEARKSTSNEQSTLPAAPEFTVRYRIGEPIAKGGMGEIHRAVDELFDREVALKRLLPKYTGDREAHERFRKEATLSARLQHPGIPPIHDLGRLPDGTPFIAMKLIAGRTLADLLKERANPSTGIQQFLSIFEQISRAVGYAHAQGVIHRDLKPANVMVGAFGEVQVMDWGLAKNVGADEAPKASVDETSSDPLERTVDGTIMGTIAYMAPEQARGEISQLDARVDVFSLGAILLEILTGAGLYEGQSKRDLLVKAQAGQFTPAILRLRNSGAHTDLVELATKCLAAKRASRPDDGNAVANAVVEHQVKIESLLRQSESERASAISAAKEQVKRRRLVVVAASIVAAVLSVGIGVSTFLGLQARHFAGKADSEAYKANQEKLETERQLSLSKVVRVADEIQTRPTSLSQDLLDRIPIEHRGWEHGWLVREAQGTPFTLYGHEAAVCSIAVSPDGTRVASGSEDHTVKIWNADNGDEQLTIRVGGTDWGNPYFSENGTQIISGTKIWDLGSGAEVRTIRAPMIPASSTQLSPDGEHLLTILRKGPIQLWDAQTTKEIATIAADEKSVRVDGFTSDGQHILGCIATKFGKVEALKVWRADTGEPAASFDVQLDEVKCIALSPDATRIACGVRGNVKVWDIRTRMEMNTFRKVGADPRAVMFQAHNDDVTSVAFSPDGARIASGSVDRTITLWNVSTGTPLDSFRGHEGPVRAVVFSPDGARIFSASNDKTVKVWDAYRGPAPRPLQNHGDSIGGVAVSPDGKLIASASFDGSVKIWSTRTGAELASFRGYADGCISANVAFNSDGTQIVRSASNFEKSGVVQVWDLKSEKEVVTIAGPTVEDQASQMMRYTNGAGDKEISAWNMMRRLNEMKPSHLINTAVISPDGKQIAIGTNDNLISLWDARTGSQLATLRGHEEGITSLAFSPNGTLLASGSYDRTIKLWESRTGAELGTLSGHQLGVKSVVFNADGTQLASGSEDKTVRIWDPISKAEVTTLRGHQGVITSATFTPDGKRLASASHDHTLKLWDVATATELVTIPCILPNSVAFTPDGTRAVVGAGVYVMIFDVRTAVVPVRLQGHADHVTSLTFSFDSTRLVSGSVDNTFRLWDTTNGSELATFKHGSRLHSAVAFSPHTMQLASAASENSIRISDARTGIELAKITGHKGPVASVAFNSNGSRIVSGAFDNTIKVWDSHSRQEVSTLLGHTDDVTSVVFSPDDKRIISDAQDGVLKVWDAVKGTEIASLKGDRDRLNSIAVNSDGTKIAQGVWSFKPSVQPQVLLWEARNDAQPKGFFGIAFAVMFSPNGDQLIVKDIEERVRVWDTSNGEENEYAAIPPGLIDRIRSPDGKTQVVKSEYDLLLVRRSQNWADLWSEDYDRRQFWKPINHTIHAATYEQDRQWFAAAWHLQRLAELKPILTPELRQLTQDKFKTSGDFLEDVLTRLKRAEDELVGRSFGNP
jgi:WD40 repeat protein/serine/threonine protein kinase